MVDSVRLLNLLSRITGRLVILDEYATEDPNDLVTRRRDMGDLKYTFQTAIEACIDAAHHVAASDGLEVPATNADSFRTLAKASLLDHQTAEVLAGAVGFRNVLVHGYADVDDGQVVANLSHLGDLRSFVRAMTGLLDPDVTS